MKILFKKSGLFSLDPVYGPVLVCIEGEHADIPEKARVEDIIASGWAERITVGMTPERTEPMAPDTHKAPAVAGKVPDKIVPPWEAPDWSPRAKDAKDRLQAYADACGLGIDLDLRHSVRVLIKTILAAEETS